MTTALQQQAGVLLVDPNLMPDHMVIDIVRQDLAEETLTAVAKAAIAGNQCRVEIMKSCITAEPSHARTHTP